MALIYGLGGGTGAMCGGFVSDRVVRATGGARWYMWGSALTVLLSAPFAFFVFLSSKPIIALLFLIVPITLMHAFLGPVTAMIQGLAGLRRRAVAAFCICPPGARAKMPTYFCAHPKEYD